MRNPVPNLDQKEPKRQSKASPKKYRLTLSYLNAQSLKAKRLKPTSAIYYRKKKYRKVKKECRKGSIM